MIYTSKKQRIFKVVEGFSAVLTSITTAVYLSLLIFLVLSERLGHTRVIALFTRMFPSKELQSVTLVLVGLIVLGAITMWSFSDDRLSFLAILNGVLTVTAAVFFLLFTRIFLFVAVVAVCVLYLIVAILRTVLLFKNFDRDID